MYNPNSVSMALAQQDFDSYWKNTSSFASINTFITMNYAGLKDDVMTMLSGGKVYVNTETFQNDLLCLPIKGRSNRLGIDVWISGAAEEESAYIINYECKTSGGIEYRKLERGGRIHCKV